VLVDDAGAYVGDFRPLGEAVDDEGVTGLVVRDGDVEKDDGLIERQAMATRAACLQMTERHLAALRQRGASILFSGQVSLAPEGHGAREIFRLLASRADDPLTGGSFGMTADA
jgi:hypothetical protein